MHFSTQFSWYPKYFLAFANERCKIGMGSSSIREHSIWLKEAGYKCSASRKTNFPIRLEQAYFCTGKMRRLVRPTKQPRLKTNGRIILEHGRDNIASHLGYSLSNWILEKYFSVETRPQDSRGDKCGSRRNFETERTIPSGRTNVLAIPFISSLKSVRMTLVILYRTLTSSVIRFTIK